MKKNLFINLTPLLDVILIFLFLFFYFYKKKEDHFLKYSEIELIQKKKFSKLTQVPKNKIEIKMEKNGSIFFNGKFLKINNLKKKLENKISINSDFLILLYVDQKLSIQVLLDVYSIFESLKVLENVILRVNGK